MASLLSVMCNWFFNGSRCATRMAQVTYMPRISTKCAHDYTQVGVGTRSSAQFGVGPVLSETQANEKRGRDLPILAFLWARSKHLCQDCPRRKGRPACRQGESKTSKSPTNPNHFHAPLHSYTAREGERRFYPAYPSEPQYACSWQQKKLTHDSVSMPLSLPRRHTDFSPALLHSSRLLSPWFNRGGLLATAITTLDLRFAHGRHASPSSSFRRGGEPHVRHGFEHGVPAPSVASALRLVRRVRLRRAVRYVCCTHLLLRDFFHMLISNLLDLHVAFGFCV